VLRRNDLPEDRFGGGTIVPGLRDAHIHPVGYTAALNRLVVKNAADFDELVILVREAAAGLPPGETVIGIRLDDDHLAEGRLPTRTVLDAAVTDRPAIVYRYCGHLAVVNTAALEEAGIGPNTPILSADHSTAMKTAPRTASSAKTQLP
jgi:predicted amidohydrolase YtcJ